MGSDTLWEGRFWYFPILHRKMSNSSVCNFAGLIQTSERFFIPDVSANSVLVFIYVANIHLGRQNMS